MGSNGADVACISKQLLVCQWLVATYGGWSSCGVIMYQCILLPNGWKKCTSFRKILAFCDLSLLVRKEFSPSLTLDHQRIIAPSMPTDPPQHSKHQGETALVFIAICSTQHLPSVLWHCWWGHLTRKNPSPIWPIICLVGRYTLRYPPSIFTGNLVVFSGSELPRALLCRVRKLQKELLNEKWYNCDT